ncbi:MAG: hypothetical protein ACI85O_003590 [Saprospiraceae bacterium]|jgi:hypothetical protein
MTYEKILIESVKLPWKLDISKTDFKLNSTEYGIFQNNQKVVGSLKTIIFFLANLLSR